MLTFGHLIINTFNHNEQQDKKIYSSGRRDSTVLV